MPRTPRPVPFLLAAAALALAGCTSTVTGTAAPAGAVTGGTPSTSASAAPTPTAPPSTAASDDDAVEWVDQICGALIPLIRTASTPPPLDQVEDPAELVTGLSGYFGAAADSAESAADGIAAAGPSPVEGGDDVARGITTVVTTFQTTYEDAKNQVDAIDPSDPQALASAFPALLAPLEQLGSMPDPTGDLRSNPELDAAAAKAPNCKKLESQTG